MENGNIVSCIEHLERTKADVPRELWMTEIGKGLQYLHQEQVVHGDLRGANILIDDDLHVRLADFGLSMLTDSNPLSASPSRNGGTGRWSAPELVQGSQPSFKSDIWSFACVCIQVYTCLPPFGHLTDWQVIRHIMDGDLPEKPSAHTGIQQYMLNLLDVCLKPDPSSRPDASSLVRVLSRCGPIAAREKAKRQKPLPATPPPETNDGEESSAVPDTSSLETPTSPTNSRSPSSSPSDALEPAQYLNIAPMSPLSLHSFIMVPSTPSSNSQESHILLPSSPSAHSSESHVVVSGSSSAPSHVSRSPQLSSFPPSSSVTHVSSDASSGYDMLLDAPDSTS